MILKEIKYKDSNTKFDWEQVPDEDLWEDGELGFKEVERKIIEHLQIIGDWKLIKKTDKENNNGKWFNKRCK